MKHGLSHDDCHLTTKYRRLDHGSVSVHKSSTVESLLDICSKVVAQHLPFEYVEKTLIHVPEPVQEKIIFYSFPRCDSDIYTYASYNPKNEKCRDKIPYYEGLQYYQNDRVENVIQIGFHLTGSVKRSTDCATDHDNKFKVSITFDRCKIISACCDCGNKGLSWCPHVVALALYRIRQPQLVDYRSPISDALVRMDRDQLQKFAQYLIASHPNKVLPSAQQLADELLQPESTINKMSGAPDPTAGASVEDVAAWYLDEDGVREQLRSELANLSCNGALSIPPCGVLGLGGSRASAERLSTLTAMASRSSNDATVGVDPGAVSRSGNQVQTETIAGDLEQNSTNQNNRNASSGIGLQWLCRYRQFNINQNLFFSPPSESAFSLSDQTNPSSTAPSHRCEHTQELASEWFSRNTLGDLFPDLDPLHSHHGLPGRGTHLSAMFAKVRELLAKRDSNGPRLLCLITEELLRYPKLPLSKSRRAQRNGDLTSRMSLPNLNRLHSSYRYSSPAAGTHESNFGPHQAPVWTTRLWDEICHLWTCVVLNPEFNSETRRSWRARFVSWIRTYRCPQDEAYAVPSNYFSAFRDQNDADADPAQSIPSSQSGRSSRRATVFQLPIEASFMSWDNECLRQLLGADTIKRNSSDSNTTSSSSSETPRWSFSGTPRTNGAGRTQSTNSSLPPDCRCPYCDFNTPMAEPFPLLCLRISALRSNGYFTQALRLAVFISQRLVRSFKLKVSGVANSLFHWNANAPPANQPHTPQYHPHPLDLQVRRTLFPASGPNSRSLTPYHPGSRYNPTGNPLSSPPHFPSSKYTSHGSGVVSSPRPSSISPPSTIPSRPGSRRQVISPSGCLSPAPGSQPNWNGFLFSPHSASPKVTPFPFGSPPPTYPYCHPSVPASNTSSFGPHFHPNRHSSLHSFRSPPTPYPLPHSAYGPKLITRSPVGYSPSRISAPLLGPFPADFTSDLFLMLSGSSSFGGVNHTETGWLGLPGRPILCLIECLLDAAAIAVESEYRGSLEVTDLRFGRLESPAFYLSLSVKVGLLSLFQQRCLSGSATRLLSAHAQELRLLALLSTMPKDSCMLSAFCEPLLFLLGPPFMTKSVFKPEQPSWSPITWSWSALSPLIHSDSYPIHTATRFVMDFIAAAQKQSQVNQIPNCWTSVAGHVSSIRVEELLFVVAARSVRFSVMETVSDNLALPSFWPRFSETPGRGNRYSDGFYYNDSIRHLEVNTAFPDAATGYSPGFDPVDPESAASDRDLHSPGRYNHPPPARSVPPTLDHHPSAIMQPYPPLPSVLYNAVQSYLRDADSTAYPPLSVPPTHVVYRRNGLNTQSNNSLDHPLTAFQHNPAARRCVEGMELQQILLAVTMARLSKSSLHRLDQTAQICDRHVHSAVSLLTISQQIFAEAVGLDFGLSGTQDPASSFKPNCCPTFGGGVGLYPFCSTTGVTPATTCSTATLLDATSVPRDRIHLLCTAFHLSLIVLHRTLRRTVQWRRREMLAWAVCTALHLGPSACMHLLTHWAVYVTPNEAVSWLATAILSVINRPDQEPSVAHSKQSVVPAPDPSCLCQPSLEVDPDHLHSFGGSDSNPALWPAWSGFLPTPTLVPLRGMHANLIVVAMQLLGNTSLYSPSAREHMYSAIHTMAMQAATKDPVSCYLPALNLTERNAAAFDAVYRLILQAAETGDLGPVQLFTLARYMDSRGWPRRAFPFTLHAVRLFVLPTMQDNHPLKNHVLWACSLAHRLGPSALHELLNHVIRNIQCPILLSEILHRCRLSPCGTGHMPTCPLNNAVPVDPMMESNPSARSTHFHVYHSGNASGALGKFPLSLDRPPLKALLDATVNAFVTATHARLSNISPRQYAEFVDFLARARDTFHLVRPDGPAQFHSLVECLRHTYRGKRKLVALLAERFG